MYSLLNGMIVNELGWMAFLLFQTFLIPIT